MGAIRARILPRIVFQIRILNDGDLALGRVNRGTDGSSLALVPAVAQHPDQVRHPGRFGLCDFGRAVRRTVVYDDEFPFDSFRQRRGQNAVEQRTDEFLLVVKGNKYREKPGAH